MCGRFTLALPPELLAELFRLGQVPELAALTPRYNIAPTQEVPIVQEGRQLVLARWGLSAGSAPPSARLINARQETVFTQGAFRAAVERRRCLVPAQAFYEWQRRGKDKQPFKIGLRRPAFAMAGIWSRWRAPDGGAVLSCAVLTTAANEKVAPLHDRMPVILAPPDEDLWLDPAVHGRPALERLFQPYPPGEMYAVPVSTRVNDVKNDDPACAEPVEVATRPQLGFTFPE